jgi:UDP-3-O-[3-hydroxymyristoyl] glucosamine N-acyltransferase
VATGNSLTLAELAAALDARVHGDGSIRLERVAPLERADATALSFFSNTRYRPQLRQTKAGAVILAADALDDCPGAALVCSNPHYAYARAAQLLSPAPLRSPGIHPSASIHPQAVIGAEASIGPQAVVEARARLGARVTLGAGSVVGAGAQVGDDTWIGANATVAHEVVIGDRVVVHPGAVLGSDGFGFARGPQGWAKVPQLGGLRIGNDCDIGANTTIDRGALNDTLIGDDVKIDNLVQIGHNVRVGARTVIAGCTAVAGSVVIGENCLIGGQSAIAGHIEIADGVSLMGMSGVTGTLREPGAYASAPPLSPVRQWRKNTVRYGHLDEMYRRLKALEKELEELRRSGSE